MLVRTEPFSSTAADTTGSTWLRAANPIRKPCRKLKTCRGPGLVSPPITLPNGRSPSREVNEMANLKDDRGKTLDLGNGLLEACALFPCLQNFARILGQGNRFRR